LEKWNGSLKDFLIGDTNESSVFGFA